MDNIGSSPCVTHNMKEIGTLTRRTSHSMNQGETSCKSWWSIPQLLTDLRMLCHVSKFILNNRIACNLLTDDRCMLLILNALCYRSLSNYKPDTKQFSETSSTFPTFIIYIYTHSTKLHRHKNVRVEYQAHCNLDTNKRKPY